MYTLGPFHLTNIVVYFLTITQFAINQGPRVVVQSVAVNVRVLIILFIEEETGKF
jgi:hypothetical protein